MILSSEKMLRDSGDKISPDSKRELEKAINDARPKLNSENLQELKTAQQSLESTTHKVAAEIYQQAGGGATADSEASSEPDRPNSDDKVSKEDSTVVDAEYKEM
jgi:molecular chaperone DnaK